MRPVSDTVLFEFARGKKKIIKEKLDKKINSSNKNELKQLKIKTGDVPPFSSIVTYQ